MSRSSCIRLTRMPAAVTPSPLLPQVTADDRHLIHVWRWLPHSNKYINAHYIPGWFMGPEKKITPLRMKGACAGARRGRQGGSALRRSRPGHRILRFSRSMCMSTPAITAASCLSSRNTARGQNTATIIKLNVALTPSLHPQPNERSHVCFRTGDVYFNRPHELRDGEYCEDSWLNKFPFDPDNWRTESDNKLELDKAEAARVCVWGGGVGQGPRVGQGPAAGRGAMRGMPGTADDMGPGRGQVWRQEREDPAGHRVAYASPDYDAENADDIPSATPQL